jgi:hypothetical protein
MTHWLFSCLHRGFLSYGWDERTGIAREYHWNLSAQSSSVQLRSGEESPAKYGLLTGEWWAVPSHLVINMSPPPSIARHLGRLLPIRSIPVRRTQTLPLCHTDPATATVSRLHRVQLRVQLSSRTGMNPHSEHQRRGGPREALTDYLKRSPVSSTCHG